MPVGCFKCSWLLNQHVVQRVNLNEMFSERQTVWEEELVLIDTDQ